MNALNLGWLPKPFKMRSYSRAARAEYFTVIREDYEAAVAVTNHQPTPGVRDILNRVPLRSLQQTQTQYLAAVASAVSWSDCFVLERETVAAYPDSELEANLRCQRLRYAQIASADEVAAYLKGALPVGIPTANSPGPSFDQLRSELAMVTDRILYLLTVSGPKENIRGWYTVWTVILMIVGMALIFSAYYWSWHSSSKSIKSFSPTESLYLVLFVGLVGGFVSVQQRLQQPTSVDPLYKRIELEASGFSIVASPVIGMIFACVLFVIMIGGLLKSGVFPDFICLQSDPRCSEHDLASFAAAATPADAASWAKLAVWAFAAGFLERLVPDILTRLSTVATDAKT